MCKFCENEESLKHKIEMNCCRIESHASSIKGSELLVCSLVHEPTPYLINFSMPINVCPMCGRDLRSEQNAKN